MRHRRSRNLDDAAISEIVGIVDGCTGPLSWNLLIEAIDERTRVRYTRQALNNHERIKLAFSVRREALKAIHGPMRVDTAPPEYAALLQINARRDAEIERLKAENARLLEQFVRWSYNANNRGVSEEVLNRPLPAVNRDSAFRRPVLTKPPSR
ncbi:MAG: hypothetical protein ACRD3E_04780 [Terriglobales bacterium]